MPDDKQTTRDVLMAETKFLVDYAKNHPDIDLMGALMFTSMKLIDAIKALDYINEVFKNYEKNHQQRKQTDDWAIRPNHRAHPPS